MRGVDSGPGRRVLARRRHASAGALASARPRGACAICQWRRTALARHLGECAQRHGARGGAARAWRSCACADVRRPLRPRLRCRDRTGTPALGRRLRHGSAAPRVARPFSRADAEGPHASTGDPVHRHSEAAARRDRVAREVLGAVRGCAVARGRPTCRRDRGRRRARGVCACSAPSRHGPAWRCGCRHRHGRVSARGTIRPRPVRVAHACARVSPRACRARAATPGRGRVRPRLQRAAPRQSRSTAQRPDPRAPDRASGRARAWESRHQASH